MDDPGDVERTAIDLLVHASRFTRILSRNAGVSRSLVAMRVLSNLRAEGPLRIGELAERELISQPAMTTTVNRLEAEGLVSREADENDGRASVVRITSRGEDELLGFRRRAAAVAVPSMQDLGPEEKKTLQHAAAVLARLVPEIDQATRGTAPDTTPKEHDPE